MTYPSDLPTVTVTHTVVGTDGRPLRGGSVRAIITERVWTPTGSILPSYYDARISEDGVWTLELPPVDHPDMQPAGAAYRIEEQGVAALGRNGRVGTDPYHIAPVLAHGAGPIDASEALVTKPPAGGGVTIQSGPVTAASAAQLLETENPFSMSLKDTIATQVEEKAGAGIVIAYSEEEADSYPPGTPVLVLKAPTRFFTDFTRDTLDTQPRGWTEHWTPATWAVREVPDATGGVALRCYADSAGVRRGLSWDLPGGPVTDVELVYRWRMNNTNGPLHCILRGSGTESLETGYRGPVRNTTRAAIGMLHEGVSTVAFTDAPGGYAAGTWQTSRFQVIGDQLKVRTWADGTPEPATWQIEVTDTTITAPGWVGFSHAFATTAEIDWVGVGVGGETAPTEAP